MLEQENDKGNRIENELTEIHEIADDENGLTDELDNNNGK